MNAKRFANVFAVAAAGLSLAACDREADRAPSAVSEGEAEALEDAASMLDEQTLPPEAIPDIQPPVEQAPDTTQTPEPPSGG